MSLLRSTRRALLWGGGGGFTGAYDAIPSIAAAYGMRRLRTAYTGNLLRLRRSSDNAESDFGYVANGDLDAAAIATFVGGGSGFVTTWYDQSGNGNNATQTTAANQPLYVASGQNSKPTIRYDGVNDLLTLGDRSALYPSAATLIATITDFSDTIYAIYQTNLTASFWRYLDNTGYMAMFRSARLTNYPESGFMPSSGDAIISHISSATTYRTYKNGVAASAAVASYAAGTVHQMGMSDGSDSAFVGDIVELIICAAELSSANRAAAETAANLYWSVF